MYTLSVSLYPYSMSIIDIFILAVTQGLTEFLPISSSGHLILARLFFGISDVDGTSLDAFLHIGTLLALLAYYWRDWWKLIQSVVAWSDQSKTTDRRVLALLVIASIPAVIVGFWWPEWLDAKLRSSSSLIWQLIITALALVVGEWLPKRERNYQSLSIKESVLIGLAQAFAIIPAISRSGMTIATARAQGLKPEDAVHFSFLMAAPVLAGAGLLSLRRLFEDAWPVEQLLFGFILSFISGLVGIIILNKLAKKISLNWFAGYLVVLAFVLWMYAG